MEEKYKVASLKPAFKPIEASIKNYEKVNEPLFTMTLCDLGIYLDCGYTIHKSFCYSCSASYLKSNMQTRFFLRMDEDSDIFYDEIWLL